MSDPAGQVATWRKVLAAILDFLMVFFGAGYAIGLLTGSVTARARSACGSSSHVPRTRGSASKRLHARP